MQPLATPIEGDEDALEMIARAADFLRNEYSEAMFDQEPDDMEEQIDSWYLGEDDIAATGEDHAQIADTATGPNGNSITGVNTGKTGERAFSIGRGSHNKIIGVNTKTAERESFRIAGGSRNLINGTNSGTAGQYSSSIGEGQAQIADTATGPNGNSITGVNTGKTRERAFSIGRGSHNRIVGVNTNTAERKSFRIVGDSRNLINGTNSGTAGQYSFSINEGQAQMYSKSGDQYIAVQPEQTYGPNQYVGGGYRTARPRPSGPNSGTTPTKTYSVRERGQVPVSSSRYNNVIKGVNTGTTGERSFSIGKGSENTIYGRNSGHAGDKSFRIAGGSKNLIRGKNSGNAGRYSFSIGQGEMQQIYIPY